MTQRIEARFDRLLGGLRVWAGRPEVWLAALSLWLLVSAARSLGTPWARAAETECLRWGAGVALTLALGAGLCRVQTGLRSAALLLGALSIAGLWDGYQPTHGGAVGPYRDHQLYGSALLILLAPALALALTGRDSRWRHGALAAFAAGAAFLFLSQTRSAWAGAVAGSLVFGSLWVWHIRPKAQARRVVAPTLAVLAASLIAFWPLLAPLEVRAPLTTRMNSLTTLQSDGSWQARLVLWRGAIRLVSAHPVTGIGLGRYPARQHGWTGAARALNPEERPSLSEQAHCFYLQTAAEIGLPGLGLYVCALLAFGVAALRRLHQTRGRRMTGQEALLVAALSALAAQAVDACASPSWQFAEASLFFWALLGLGLSALRRTAPEPVLVPAPRPVGRIGRALLSGGLAVLLVAPLLPVGLLSPVEAYTPPTQNGYQWQYVFNSLKITGPASLSVGEVGNYQLTASYYTNAAHTAQKQVTVTLDPYPPNTGSPSYYNISGGSSLATKSTFGPAGSSTRNLLLAGAADKGRTLQVSGAFYDKNLLRISLSIPVTIR